MPRKPLPHFGEVLAEVHRGWGPLPFNKFQNKQQNFIAVGSHKSRNEEMEKGNGEMKLPSGCRLAGKPHREGLASLNVRYVKHGQLESLASLKCFKG